MYTEAHFINTLDSMEPHHVLALIDIIEGDAYYRLHAVNVWVLDALTRRGLLHDRHAIEQEAIRTQQYELTAEKVVTPYGHAFLAWYRAPRDVPQQEVLL